MGLKRDNARVVHDQLSVQHAVATAKEQIHENRRQLDERAFYPAHDARKESSAYAKVHHHLCVELDLPCLACGVKNSILKTPKGATDPEQNPYGAKAVETHHYIIEWALANAIDVEHFNRALRPNLAHNHANDLTWNYEKPFDQEKVAAGVDHSEHNRSGQVLRIVSQLLALNRSAKDFPIPATVPLISR